MVITIFLLFVINSAGIEVTATNAEPLEEKKRFKYLSLGSRNSQSLERSVTMYESKRSHGVM